MCDILVEHDAIQHPTLLNLTPRNLLNPSIPLDIDGLHPPIILCYDADGLQRELAHEVGPAHDEFGANGGFDEGEHFFVICGVDGNGYAFDDLKGFFEGFIVGGDDDYWVDVAFELG